jgi:hypothetical protein
MNPQRIGRIPLRRTIHEARAIPQNHPDDPQTRPSPSRIPCRSIRWGFGTVMTTPCASCIRRARCKFKMGDSSNLQ